MDLVIFGLIILIVLLFILILKEFSYLKSIFYKKIKFKQKQPRLIVPSPSELKISEERPKTASWLHNISSKISEIDFSRDILKRRLATKHAQAEAIKESEEEKKERLRKKIEELEKKAIKSFVKPVHQTKTTSAIDMAIEASQMEHQEEQDIPIFSTQIEDETTNSEVESFNSHLASVYIKINNKELHEAKQLYQELIQIYNSLMHKVENKLELYNTLKDVHSKIIAAAESE